MSNIHDAKELAYWLIRHARSAPGHTPLVTLTVSDAALLETLLVYAVAREELGTVCEDCKLRTKGLIMKSNHHGGVKVVCIDRFESLDPQSREEFIKLVEKDKVFEYFITQVTSGPLNMEVTGDTLSSPEAPDQAPASTENVAGF